MLDISDLYASINGTEILSGLNLRVQPGEVHAIMGPNGAGKSTLSKIISGHPAYEVTSGDVRFEINFKNKSILELDPDERARLGIFLAFQYPVEVPGVNNEEFLRASFNAMSRDQGIEEMDSASFKEFVKSKVEFLGMRSEFLDRQVNVDFSGGEKKRNEILQMAVLSPKLAILDETDSGLDVDSLRAVAEGVNKLKSNENAFVLITHYQKLLDYIVPDFVHILYEGKIIKTGDKSLALEIENDGYDKFIN